MILALNTGKMSATVRRLVARALSAAVAGSAATFGRLSRADDGSSASSKHTPAYSQSLDKPAGARSTDQQLVRSMRVLVRDALEGDGNLWKTYLKTEDSTKAQRLLREDGADLKRKLKNMVVVAGRANPQLADEIAYELGLPLGRTACNNFADGESSVQILDSVRGKDVYVIQSTSQPVNESLLELLLMISALRRASANTITAIMPYYGYKRDVGTVSALTHLLQHGVATEQHAPSSASPQPAADNNHAPSSSYGVFAALAAELLGDRAADIHPKSSGVPPLPSSSPSPAAVQAEVGRTADVPVSASDVARMLETMGVDRVISVELQPPGQGQIEGFFESRVPVESLRATYIGADHIARLGLSKPVVVAPNEACIQLAHDFRSSLQARTGGQVGFACIVEAGPSRGSDRYVHAYHDPRSPAERMELVGDVHGRDVIVVDDMLDTGRTLMTRLNLLKERGANRLVAYACHGLFNDGALQRITKSPLSDVVVTNTVPLRDDVDMRHTHKIAQLSVAPLLAEAALRTQLGLSLLHLRKAVSGEQARYKGQE